MAYDQDTMNTRPIRQDEDLLNGGRGVDPLMDDGTAPENEELGTEALGAGAGALGGAAVGMAVEGTVGAGAGAGAGDQVEEEVEEGAPSRSAEQPRY